MSNTTRRFRRAYKRRVKAGWRPRKAKPRTKTERNRAKRLRRKNRQ